MFTNRPILFSFALTLTFSLGGGFYTAYSNEQIVERELIRASNAVVQQWHIQLERVEHAIRGLRGAIITKGPSFNQHTLDLYIQSRDLAREFPVIRSLAIVKRVSPSEQVEWLKAASAENPALEFRQYNQHDTDRYILQYVTPVSIFGGGFGLDIGSEAIRRKALDDAAQQNAFWLTPPLKSTSQTLSHSPDYFAVLPIFLEGETINFGWTGAPIFISDFFNQLNRVGEELAISVSEQSVNFVSNNYPLVDTNITWLFGTHRGETIQHQLQVNQAGRQWAINVLPTPKFFIKLNLTSPWTVSSIIAVIGSLLTVLINLQKLRKKEHDALEQNQQQQLGSLIDAAPCGMMFINSQYQFVAVNRQLCEQTGYTRKELLDTNFQAIMGEQDNGNNLLMCYSESQQGRFNNYARSGTINFEMLVKRKNGTIFPAAIGFSTLKLGNSTHIIATLEDISRRRDIERKIAKSEIMFRQLANAMPQQVWTFTADGKLSYVNQRWVDYFNMSHEEASTGKWLKAVHPEDRHIAFNQWRESLKTGNEYRVELRIQRHDGAYLWHAARAIAAKNSRGEIVAWYGTNTDISDVKKAQLDIENSARNTQTIIDSVIDGIITIDEKGSIRTLNQAAETIFGYSEKEILGKNIKILMPEPYQSLHDQYLENYLATGAAKVIGKSTTLDGLHRDGGIFKMELRVAEIYTDGNRYFIGMVRDITERYYNEKLLEAQDHILGLIARNAELAACLEALALDIEALAPDVKASILILDESGQRLLHGAAPSLSSSYNAAINGVEIGEKVGSCGTAAYLRKQIITEDISTDPRWEDYRDLAAEHKLRACWSTPIFSENQLLGTFALYFPTPRKPGANHRRVIKMATHVASLAITHDQRESKIRQLAFYDSLTNLPNRSLGMDRLNRGLADAQRRHEKLAVIFIDLDSFKTINDSLGHHVGDRLLQLAADRLSGCVRENDTVSRLGGDEFFVTLSGSSDNVAEVVTQKILAAMAEPFEIESHSLHASCSIGVAIYPSDGQDASTLIRNADAAMYRAKETGRNNVKYYTDEMNRTAVERITLEQEIRKGIERKEFVLYYQPRVNNITGQIIGLEALIRWQHPTRGLTTPNVFIPIAEKSGLIVALGDWVLEHACEQLSQWLEMGLKPITMAVNLSPRQLNDDGLINKIESALTNNRLPAQLLELEITESMVMDESVDILATLARLKTLGVTLAIDDFGTGYSNLSRLKHLPMDVLKIDKSFVDGIPDEIDDTAIVSTIIAMAHHLKLKIVAEGVETYKQQQFLSGKNCDEMQGYLFGKPESAATTMRLLGLSNEI